jgi:hypothetical protein
MLDVSTPDTHFVDSLRSKLGVCRLATKLELALLPVVGPLSTGGGTLVS